VEIKIFHLGANVK